MAGQRRFPPAANSSPPPLEPLGRTMLFEAPHFPITPQLLAALRFPNPDHPFDNGPYNMVHNSFTSL